jgi:hypothetical protein
MSTWFQFVALAAFFKMQKHTGSSTGLCPAKNSLLTYRRKSGIAAAAGAD